MSRLALALLAAALTAACGDGRPRKIQLAGDGDRATTETAEASVLKVEPERERSVGVLEFHNASGDAALDWLEQGLADMLLTELGSSRHLRLQSPAHLAELLAAHPSGAADPGNLAEIARRLRTDGVEVVVGGRFHRSGSDIVIEAEVVEGDSEAATALERVSAQGLERIFSAVGDLAHRVRDRLRSSRGADREEIVAATTRSVEAYQRYIAGREKLTKLMHREALADFEAAVAIDPEFAQAWLGLARARASTVGLREALLAWEQAKAREKQLGEGGHVRLELMRAQWEGDTSRVLELADELWRAAPKDIEARVEMATWLERNRESERAREELEYIRAEDPSRKIVYNSLGYLYAERGDFTTALQHLERYRELTPGEPNAHDSIGEVLAMAGRFEEAVAAFQGALERWPNFDNSLIRLVEIQAERGDLAGALEASDRLLALPASLRNRVEFCVDRAIVLHSFGRHAEADLALAEARRSDPDSTFPGVAEALLRRARGDSSGASAVARAWFERWRSAERRAGWDSQQKIQFLYRALRLDLPPAELLPLLEELAAGESIARIRDLHRIARGVLLFRLGRLDAGREWLAGDGKEALEALVMSRYIERATLWRWLGKLVEHEPVGEVGTRLLAEHALVTAKRIGRPDLVVLARLLAIQAAARDGQAEAVRAGYVELGFAPEGLWRVAGPLPGPGAYRRVASVEPGAPVKPESGDGLSWTEPGDRAADGWLDLEGCFGPQLGAAGYATIDVISPDRRRVQVRTGSSAGIKAWLNGNPVFQMYRTKEAHLDGDMPQVYLNPGPNRLLVKAISGRSDWGFYLRITDEDGQGFADLRFAAPALVAGTGDAAVPESPSRPAASVR